MRRLTLIAVLITADVLALAAGASAAQNAQPCQINKALHTEVTNQGSDAKYAVKYQSGSGKDCRMYRVRNLAGHPATMVQWKAADETLLNVQLPACPAGMTCPWVAAAKRGQGTQPGSSDLRYGEKGEYSDTPDTFTEKHPAPGQHPEYETLLQGATADSPGKLIEVGVVAASRVEGGGPYRLTYRLSLVQGGSPQPHGRNRQAVELAQQLTIWPNAAEKPRPGDLSVEWQGITPELVHLQPGEKNVTTALSQSSPETVVSIVAKAIKLARVPLIIRSGRQRIAVTTAPVYLPVNSGKR